MGQKEYYQASIENYMLTQNGLLKLGALFFVGILVFGNLYAERHDLFGLSVIVVLIVGLLIDLYWWIKINKKIRQLQDEFLTYLRG